MLLPRISFIEHFFQFAPLVCCRGLPRLQLSVLSRKTNDLVPCHRNKMPALTHSSEDERHDIKASIVVPPSSFWCWRRRRPEPARVLIRSRASRPRLTGPSRSRQAPMDGSRKASTHCVAISRPPNRLRPPKAARGRASKMRSMCWRAPALRIAQPTQPDTTGHSPMREPCCITSRLISLPMHNFSSCSRTAGRATLELRRYPHPTIVR